MAELAARRRELLDSMNRQAIFEGAVSVMSEHGLNGLTMDRVAAAAGLAKGSLYNHFKNKQELLEFVHDRAVSPMHEILREIAQSAHPAAAKLEQIARTWREHLIRHHAVFEFLINDSMIRAILRDSEQSARAKVIRQIADVFQQGIDAGDFQPLDTRQLAEMFIGAAIGMVEQEYAEDRPRSVDAAAGPLVSVFLHGVEKRVS